MAKRTIEVLTDDIDGKELKEGQGQTISFVVGRTQYELDVSEKNAERFYDALKPYTDAARKVGGRTGSQSAGSARAKSDVDTKAVRAWAEANGIEVSSRGRIAAPVLEQYRAASNS